MQLKTLKLQIGNLTHQYYKELLSPKIMTERYNAVMYGPDSLLAAVDKWIEKEEKRIAAREKGDVRT